MKVGDIVKIKENLEADKVYGNEFFTLGMEKYRGKQARIIDIITNTGKPFYKLDIDDVDDEKWNWTDDMLNPISKKYEVIVNGNTVTVKDDKGNEGIAKCSSEDEFNLSTGISLAISRFKWKPSFGEEYYTICSEYKNPIYNHIWTDDANDSCLYERGLVFKTKEEAKRAFKIMLDSIKEK